jgi:hypothetical protein
MSDDLADVVLARCTKDAPVTSMSEESNVEMRKIEKWQRVHIIALLLYHYSAK